MHKDPLQEAIEKQNNEYSEEDRQFRQEEEAHFHFTLHAFEDLVRQSGGKYVLKHLSEATTYKLWSLLSRYERVKEMDNIGFKVKYFVLKPKGQDQFAIASRAAMRTFAQSMHGHDNELANYVKAWAESETPDAPTTKPYVWDDVESYGPSA